MEIPEHRRWMYIRKDPQKNRLLRDFILGVEEFIGKASELDVFKQEGRFRCPCSKCKCLRFYEPDLVRQHLYNRGFQPHYYHWHNHGETPPSTFESRLDADADDLDPYERMVIDAEGHTFYNDGCLNRGGAISISEHIRRLGIELGRDATVPEVFLRLNYDEETGEWRNSRAEGVYNKYKSLKATRLSEGVNEADIDDSTVFYEANGGKNKRGRSYGFGSEAAFYTVNSRSNARSKTTHPTNDEVQVLQSRLSAVESELASFRSLFAKLNNGSLTPSTSSIDVPPPCEGENVANLDEVVGNENEDDGDMGIGDDDDDDDGF